MVRHCSSTASSRCSFRRCFQPQPECLALAQAGARGQGDDGVLLRPGRGQQVAGLVGGEDGQRLGLDLQQSQPVAGAEGDEPVVHGRAHHHQRGVGGVDGRRDEVGLAELLHGRDDVEAPDRSHRPAAQVRQHVAAHAVLVPVLGAVADLQAQSHMSVYSARVILPAIGAPPPAAISDCALASSSAASTRVLRRRRTWRDAVGGLPRHATAVADLAGIGRRHSSDIRVTTDVFERRIMPLTRGNSGVGGLDQVARLTRRLVPPAIRAPRTTGSTSGSASARASARPRPGRSGPQAAHHRDRTWAAFRRWGRKAPRQPRRAGPGMPGRCWQPPATSCGPVAAELCHARSRRGQ